MIISFAEPMLALPRSAKRVLALGVDALGALTVWLALCLRLDSWVLPQGNQWFAVGLSPVLALPIFVVLGLYRAIFRYAGMAALIAVTKAVVIYGLFFIALMAVLAL